MANVSIVRHAAQPTGTRLLGARRQDELASVEVGSNRELWAIVIVEPSQADGGAALLECNLNGFVFTEAAVEADGEAAGGVVED